MQAGLHLHMHLVITLVYEREYSTALLSLRSYDDTRHHQSQSQAEQQHMTWHLIWYRVRG
jgi:hypothetical protein